MTQPVAANTVVHHTFSLERNYTAKPKRVFAAFSNQAKKRRWFAEGEGWQIDEFTMDFRVGGTETARYSFQGGPPMGSDTIYLDIMPEQRIVFAYTMHADGKRISSSLTTIELEPTETGSRLVYTEQGAFFDGAEQPAMRELGCRELLEQLAQELSMHG